MRCGRLADTNGKGLEVPPRSSSDGEQQACQEEESSKGGQEASHSRSPLEVC